MTKEVLGDNIVTPGFVTAERKLLLSPRIVKELFWVLDMEAKYKIDAYPPTLELKPEDLQRFYKIPNRVAIALANVHNKQDYYNKIEVNYNIDGTQFSFGGVIYNKKNYPYTSKEIVDSNQVL